MSQFWILLELRVVEVVVTTEAISCAKLQSNRQINSSEYLCLRAARIISAGVAG